MNPSRGKRRYVYLLDINMSYFHCPWVLWVLESSRAGSCILWEYHTPRTDFRLPRNYTEQKKSRSSIWQHWRSRRRQWSPWISYSRPFANHGGGSASSIFLSRDASPSVFLCTAGKCNPNPKNRQWCDLGKNHFDSVFLWIEWFHPWGRLGYMRMTGMILWRFIQNLFEMEYTYKKAMDSILGQREMVLFERIIICGWHNSTRTVAIK